MRFFINDPICKSVEGFQTERPAPFLFSMPFSGDLQRDGYVVVPSNCFTPAHRAELLGEASHFPEFNPGTTQFVMGGFAALGCPSSFHNPVVRKYRQWMHSILVTKLFSPLVATYADPGEWKLDHIIDRMVIRVPGQRPSTEPFHRDEASELIASSDDKVFGGWVNLDEADQFFSCVPGTHMPDTNNHRGFSKIPKEEAREIRAKKLTRTVRIPSGHMLVFYENIVHEVVSRVARQTLVRLHLGFRLTRSVDVRPVDLMEKIDSQGVIMIKSGQIPGMYAKLHAVNWIEKLEEWSSTHVANRCLVSHTFKTGKRVGQTFTICDKHLKGFPMYPAYTPGEKQLHTPRRSWTLLAPGSTTDFVQCSL